MNLKFRLFDLHPMRSLDCDTVCFS